jgi:ABC-2 type transport system permease protein
VLATVWVLALTAMCGASAVATVDLYSGTAELRDAAHLINQSPALVALYGPILDEHSLGEIAMSKTTVMYAMFVMLMTLVLVRRHTRGEEESGRFELVGATAVDRATPTLAATAYAVTVVVVLGVLSAVADVAGGLPVQGSLLFGASWLGIGLVGIGVAVVACQLSASTRTCGALGLVAVAVLYLMRAAGDVGPGWLSWLSPLGWGTRLQAWGDPRWWVLLLYPLTAGGLVVLGWAMHRRRDLGSGLLAARPGPSVAADWLRSAASLELRLERTALIGWTVGTLVLGAVFGSIAPTLGDFFKSDAARAALRALGGRGAIEDALLAALLHISAYVVTGFGLSVVAAAGAEEREGRTAVVLATGSARRSVFGAVLGMVVGGSLWLLLTTGLGMALGFGAQTGDVIDGLARVLPAVAAYTPAVLVTVGLGLAAFAWSAHWSGAGWGVLFVFLTLGELGDLLHLPDWAIGLSPFQHVPSLPGGTVHATPLVVLSVLATAVAFGAWLRYRSRDID